MYTPGGIAAEEAVQYVPCQNHRFWQPPVKAASQIIDFVYYLTWEQYY